MHQRISTFTTLLTLTILLAGSTIILSGRLTTPTGSLSPKAATTTSTGYIPPTLTAAQKAAAADLTRLFSSLPVSQPTFKITFDYYQDKYLVTYIGNTTTAQTNFLNWLSVNKYSTLYPTYFTFSASVPPTPLPTAYATVSPTRTPTSIPTRTPTPTPTKIPILSPTPATCTGKTPICIDCVQCINGVWTCVSCSLY